MNLPKAFIFGIDGGTFDVIAPLSAIGLLPNLSRLLREGASATTQTTWPPHTGPGWASLVSSGNPGHHGIFQFFGTQEPDYRARILGTEDYGCSTVWDWLAWAGKTVGLINIPMSHPHRNLPGYQVTWPLVQTLRYCHPPGLLGEMAKAGAHFQSDLATMYRGNLTYIHDALASISARGKAAKYLLETQSADVVMMVLTESDRVCHHYWHFSDPNHPQHCQPDDPAYSVAVQDTYVAIDRVLGELLDCLPDECTVVVTSDHGFGAGHESLAIHRVLEGAGLLRTTALQAPGTSMSRQASWFSDHSCQIDWTKTSVYMPVPGSYGLNINLKGRQKEGIIDSASVDSLLDSVASLCLGLRHPAKGSPVFSTVLRREEAFHGGRSGQAPDLLLVPHDEALMVSPEISGNTWGKSYQTGLHRFEGMWIQRSKRTKPGRLKESIRLIDIMPTLMADLDVRFPADVPGNVVMEAFESGGRVERSNGPAFTPGSGKQPDWEDEELTSRLRSMGYL